MVGYDGGRIAAEGLADHVIVTRSQHIPRIQEAQASAYHVLRELVELVGAVGSPAGAPRPGAGRGRPCRGSASGPSCYRLARELGARRAASCNDERGVLLEVEGDAEARRALLGAAAARGAAAGRRSSACEPRGVEPRRRARASAIVESERGGEPAGRSSRPTSATCADCLAELLRPRRPPPPLPVHQLHELRPALHDRARRPLRPPADDDGRLRDVRAPAAPSTTTRATAASTPSRTRARTAARALRLRRRRRRRSPARGDAARARPRRAARRARSWRSRGIGGYHLACRAADERGRGGAARAQAPRGQAVRADGRRPRRRARAGRARRAEEERCCAAPRARRSCSRAGAPDAAVAAAVAPALARARA